MSNENLKRQAEAGDSERNDGDIKLHGSFLTNGGRAKPARVKDKVISPITGRPAETEEGGKRLARVSDFTRSASQEYRNGQEIRHSMARPKQRALGPAAVVELDNSPIRLQDDRSTAGFILVPGDEATNPMFNESLFAPELPSMAAGYSQPSSRNNMDTSNRAFSEAVDSSLKVNSMTEWNEELGSDVSQPDGLVSSPGRQLGFNPGGDIVLSDDVNTLKAAPGDVYHNSSPIPAAAPKFPTANTDSGYASMGRLSMMQTAGDSTDDAGEFDCAATVYSVAQSISEDDVEMYTLQFAEALVDYVATELETTKSSEYSQLVEALGGSLPQLLRAFALRL